MICSSTNFAPSLICAACCGIAIETMAEENQKGTQHPINQKLLSLSRHLKGALRSEHWHLSPVEAGDTTARERIEERLHKLKIKVSADEREVLHIPESGPAICLANHPMGGVDVLLALQVLLSRRSDVVVFGNFEMDADAAISGHLREIDEHALREEAGYAAFRQKLGAELEQGRLVLLFPAMQVSAYNLQAKTVRDRVWRRGILSAVKEAECPVIPLFIRGNNKLLLHLLQAIKPKGMTIKLPSGFLSKKEEEIALRIGKMLRPHDLSEFTEVEEFTRFLRAKVYMLGSGLPVKAFFRPVLFRKKWKSVVLPRDVEAISAEIEFLKGQGAMLHESKEFEVYWAHSDWIPNMLYEIGRLREITFREVGEGTGKNIDLDEYDLYYRHLFIWDKNEKKLVGAYRMGMGKEIMQRLGKQGFYLNSLFRMKPDFSEVLKESIELGRSFVSKEYQLKPLSLFLLWKGILYFILKHPDYRYLIGPVSISGEFSKISKYLIISFIKKHYYDAELAAMVSPRHEYIPEVDVRDPDMDAIRGLADEDIKKLDRIIEEIEMGNFRLPALLKKYLGQNARIIAFNVDPKFNNALDGLLVMDLFKVPLDTLHGLAKEFGDKSLIDKFASRGEAQTAREDHSGNLS